MAQLDPTCFCLGANLVPRAPTLHPSWPKMAPRGPRQDPWTLQNNGFPAGKTWYLRKSPFSHSISLKMLQEGPRELNLVSLGALLGASWPLLGPSWAHLGLSGVPLWLILALLGPSWVSLGPSWPLLGSCWPLLGPSWAHLSPSGAPLGLILAPIGPDLAPSWPILAPTWSQESQFCTLVGQR